MDKSKGFTIIELIVVIAIIAVLAAIVLVNVTSYISKGKDAAIKGNLASLVLRGTKFFEDSTLGNGTYTNFCAHASGGVPIKAAIESTSLDGGRYPHMHLRHWISRLYYYNSIYKMVRLRAIKSHIG